MTKRRKTKAERESDWYEAERRVWETFKPRLAGLKTFAEAQQLVSEAPPPDSPGRSYYSNLGFFLQQFAVPGGSNEEERALYAQFIERLDSANAMTPGSAEAVLEALRPSSDAG